MTENNEFFEDGIRKAQRLALSANNREIVASTMIEEIGNIHSPDTVKVITRGQESFLNNFCEITEKSLSDDNFRISKLCQEIGISRAQMYRNIRSISGRSPNGLIRDMRMKRALTLLKEKNFNISEIAHKVGYSSPSYFIRRFCETYGLTPSKMATY